MPLDDAYAACEAIARAHYENFPVASRLLPKAMRPHVAAVYAFARGADDIADEGSLTSEERSRQLDEWLAQLHAAAASPASVNAASDPIFAAVAHTIHVCDLPLALFGDLVSAFRQDVTVRRYADWDALYDYCRRSANPVGRLVLRIAGHRDERLDAASDAVCTALQLTNFWQDLAVDWRRGRLYLPESERAAAGADEADLGAGRITPAWRMALSRAAARTADLFARGRPVADGIGGRLGWELRLTWLGGMRILERLERGGFDVFTSRPSLGAADAPVLLWRLAAWRRGAPAAGRPAVRTL